MKKCGTISIEGITLAQAKANRKVAHVACLKEVRKAPDSRKKFQESLAKALAEANDTKKSSKLKNLKQREKQRNQARRIRRMRGKFKSGKVTTMYQTTKIDGVQVREECTTQDQMNEAAMTENEARFSRALQGAFMQPEL